MSPDSVGYWYRNTKHVWHRRNPGTRRTSCGKRWGAVQAVSSQTRPPGKVCPGCVQATEQRQRPIDPATPAGLGTRPSKALRAKMAELRAKGIDERWVEALALDDLGRARSRSVRALQGGLPTMGKHR